MSSYCVQLEQFEGPLALLLELIEQDKLSVSDVSLGQITESFLGHLEHVEEVAPHDVADFLVVAGRLLYLKSKLLLPELALEEDDEMGLASQLRIYQRFAEASKRLGEMVLSNHAAYAAPRMTIDVPTFSPPEHLTGLDLASALRGLVEKVRPYVDLPERLLERTVTVEEKIEDLKRRIEQETTILFHDLAQRGSKSDVVTSFLALLELLKQNILRVEQRGHFADIAISRV